MSRTLKPILVAAALLSMSAGPAPNLPPLEAAEYEVLRALLRERLQGDPKRTLVIRREIAPDQNPAHLSQALTAELPDLEVRTLETFEARLRAGGLLEDHFGLTAPVYLIAQEEADAFWKDRDGCEAGWKRYRAAHPNATGLIEVSRVGINVDATQALVYLGAQGSCLGGGGGIFELEKFKGDWKVVQEVHLWDS